MSDSNGFMKYVVFGSATVIAVGAGYLAYKYLFCEEEEDVGRPSPAPISNKKPPAGVGPSLPVRSAPVVKKAAPKAPGASLKTCANCSKALSGLPLRCSKCKAVYYCSPDCQKSAVQAHKEVCGVNAPTKPASTATSQPESSTASSTGGDSQDAEPRAAQV